MIMQKIPYIRYIFFIGNSYQIQANQWAIRANVAISRMSTAAPYSEYLSIFLATRTNLSNLAVLSNPMSVVVSSVSDPKSNKSNGMAATRSMMNLKKISKNIQMDDGKFRLLYFDRNFQTQVEKSSLYLLRFICFVLTENSWRARF